VANEVRIRPPGPVTLRDVAERAGVSITTVSRILNGRETGVPIRDDTRQRILDAAADLGYRPNMLARALRGSRSWLLGVIVRDISDPFHIHVLRGINEAARERDYRLFLGHLDWRPSEAAVFGSMFEQSHADGILLIGDMVGGDATLDALADRNPYVVGVTDRVSRRRVPGIYADNDLGTRLALDHLWSLGHRDIICVIDDRMADGPFRASVYERYLREHRAADAIRVYRTSQPDSAPAFRLGQELFTGAGGSRPTAIFAASDTIAIGLLQAAFQHGIGVPEQLSIVGFDDVDAATYMIPPLTTVSQRGTEMGALAANLILDMIERQRRVDEVDDVVVTPRLVVRQSTGPAPATIGSIGREEASR
jgi:DNA-binding LacI/PurR family transcriptional regulator